MTKMSLTQAQGVCKRAVVLVVASFYGVLVGLKLLWDAIKLGPGALFPQKKRNKPPACLEDPDLGTHGYAHLENIRMHYVSNGAEDKPLMLLVHGFPEFWYSWRYQLREFKDSYRVVAVDLRGYGESDKPSGKGNYSVPVLVNDLKQMVTALGYKSCVLVGHDWGGVLAWSFAETFPEMVSHLVVLNCPHAQAMEKHMRTAKQFRMSWYIFFYQLPWLPEFAMRFNDFAALEFMMRTKEYGVKSDCMTEADLEAYKYTFSRNSMTGPINFYRSFLSLASLSRDSPPSGRGGSVATPTLVVWGDDIFLDKPLAEMSAQVCTGKVSVQYVPGASHWVQMDRPDLVNKHIRDFLAQD